MSVSGIPVVLTIAGFDPSSGAGITADLKTIAALGCYGVAAITGMTVQNTGGISRVESINPVLLAETLTSLAADNDFAAIKVGMLGSADNATVVANFLQNIGAKVVVVDPILRSTSGTALLDEAGIEVLRNRLTRIASVITPNSYEAEVLVSGRVSSVKEARSAAKKIQGSGARNVVVTGGHLPGNTDVLLMEAGEFVEFPGPVVESKATHGTGCAFSTALACELAQGKPLAEAVRGAKEYVRRAIESAYPIGKGTGPINHLFRLK